MVWYVLAPGAVVSVLGAVGGVAAIRTGWLPPWMGGKTFRPRLWGYATLLASANLAAQVVGWAIADPRSKLLIISAGSVSLLVTFGLLLASQQPGRTR
ncbi:MAG: hypothetical protein JWO67_4546 [Streptosporangiaceae bacterium]|nr:hypothetical protein [Streptosporangiaceae bacterium]